MRPIVLAVVLAITAPAAHAQDNAARAETIITAFSAICRISDGALELAAARDRALAAGLSHDPQLDFHHGPEGLARESHWAIASEELSVAQFNSDDGYCVVRFAPLERDVMVAALTRLLGAHAVEVAEATTWRRQRAGAESIIVYRPYAGQSGPVWVLGPGGYRYGFDAAAEQDALIFYPRQMH